MEINNINISTTNEIQSLMREGKFKEAEKILERAMRTTNNPKFKSLHVKLNMVEGKYEKAIKLVNKYIKEYPYDGTFIAQKVEALVGNGEMQLAKELLEWLVNNGLEDKRLLLQLKSIAIGENDLEKEEKIEQRLRANDERIIKKIKSLEKDNVQPRTKRNMEKRELRSKIYQKNQDMKQKIQDLNLRTLLDDKKITEKEIKEIQEYFVGMTKFGIIEGKMKTEDIQKIVKSYKKVGENRQAKSFLEELDSISYVFSDDEIKQIQKIKQETKKVNFDDYVAKVNNKIKKHPITGVDIIQIMNKINKLQGDKLEKRILAIKLFDSIGYSAYKEGAIKKAQKGIKTEEEKDLVNKAIEIIEKQKVDSIITEDKNIEQPGENIGGDSR